MAVHEPSTTVVEGPAQPGHSLKGSNRNITVAWLGPRRQQYNDRINLNKVFLQEQAYRSLLLDWL